MQAIILAGGFGTRLKSAVGDLPKPMAPLAGQPFLAWLLRYMAEQGVENAHLCLHHQPQPIMDYFGTAFCGMRLSYGIEETPLGTGGAIRRAIERLNPTEPFFALNGDSIVEVDYRRMMQHHRLSKRLFTIATKRMADCRRYSTLAVQNGLVEQYELYGDADSGLISTGLYIVSPEIFDGWIAPHSAPAPFAGMAEESASAGCFSLERDFLAGMAPAIKPAIYDDVEYFIDIGVPADYARAQHEIPARLRMLAVA